MEDAVFVLLVPMTMSNGHGDRPWWVYVKHDPNKEQEEAPPMANGRPACSVPHAVPALWLLKVG